MALRVSGQDDIIINLPEPLRPDELLDLEFVYGGRLPAMPPEREAIDVTTSALRAGERVLQHPGASQLHLHRAIRLVPAGRRHRLRDGDDAAARARRVFDGRERIARRGIPEDAAARRAHRVDGVSLQRHAARALSRLGDQPLRSRRLGVVLDRRRRRRRCAVDGRVVYVRRDYRRIERHAAAPGPRAVRRNAARDEVLRLGRLGHSVPELHAGASSSASSPAATVRRISPRSAIRRRQRPSRGAPIPRTSTGSRSSFWRTRPRISGGGRRSAGRTITSSGSARGSRSISPRCTPSM